MVLFIVAIGSAHAADPTHHFKLQKPASVKAGDKADLVITAHRKDGSQIKDAVHNLSVSITTRSGTETHKIEMRDGRAVLEVTFSEPSSHLIWIQDEKDEKLTLSDSVKVNYVMEVVR